MVSALSDPHPASFSNWRHQKSQKSSHSKLKCIKVQTFSVFRAEDVLESAAHRNSLFCALQVYCWIPLYCFTASRAVAAQVLAFSVLWILMMLWAAPATCCRDILSSALLVPHQITVPPFTGLYRSSAHFNMDGSFRYSAFPFFLLWGWQWVCGCQENFLWCWFSGS